MNDDARKNLIDIIQTGEEIQNFTRGMNFEAYQSNPVVQRAVERDFEIIGEALNRIRQIDEELVEKISEYHRIIGFRNILILGSECFQSHFFECDFSKCVSVSESFNSVENFDTSKPLVRVIVNSDSFWKVLSGYGCFFKHGF